MSAGNSSVLIPGWLQSQEGAAVLRALCNKSGTQLRVFGLLERPVLPAHPVMEDVHFKLVVVGKGGVGKSSCIARLCGRPVSESHFETAGIQTTKLLWPVKIAHLNKPVLMNLTLWDAGEMAVKKFDHILPACRENVDGILFIFSFVDKGSWDEIPHLISRLTDPNDNIAKIVIGTKFDQYAHCEVSQKELRDFELRWQTPVLKICNIPSQDATRGLSDILPILDCICERLWQKDLSKAERADK